MHLCLFIAEPGDCCMLHIKQPNVWKLCTQFGCSLIPLSVALDWLPDRHLYLFCRLSDSYFAVALFRTGVQLA